MKTNKYTKKNAEKYAILANKSFGLYAGIVGKKTTQADGSLHVEVRECRHIARWYGKTGGITSLAAHGLCGPQAKDSRIGAAADAMPLTGIVNIFICTPAARQSIESAEQS